MKLEEERALKEIKTEFSNNTPVLSSQMGNFINTVAPYLIAPDCKELRNEDSAKYLNSMTFFRLKSCTTENVDDLAAYLNQKIEKLFIAIHSINRPIVYVEFFGMNPRQGLKSDLIEQTLYMHKYFPATSDLIAIDNQGEGDYYLVDSEDVVYEYDTSLKQLRKTALKLFEYIVERFESVG